MENIFENRVFEGFSYNEAKDGLAEGVLAVVKGASFFSDGYSRNGRFYPKKLWENALGNTNTKEAITRGLMFGCIGHPKDYSLDELLESGKVSHKVVGITMDPKTGEGVAEYHILDTPSGRILNTILRSGSEMYVSTRAFGGFSNETKKKDGKEYKVLDEKNFELESIDFVIQPGFLQTNPKLVESIAEDLEILSQDKAHIKCEEGICQLGEDFKTMNETTEKVEDEVDMFEDIDDLSKEDIITMLRNVIAENALLASNPVSEVADTDDEEDGIEVSTDAKGKAKSGEMEVDAKLLANYISYIELLTKLVRYDIEFENYYDTLVEFLDKDEKISTSDMEDVKKLAEDIAKEKDVPESIAIICEKIINLTDKINDDGEDNEEDAEKTESVESVVEYLFGIIERSTGMLTEEINKNVELTTSVNHLKFASLKMAESIADPIVETVEVEVEKIVEKIVHDTPKEITEKLLSQKTIIESQETQMQNASEDFDTYKTHSMELLGEVGRERDELKEQLAESIDVARESLATFEVEKTTLSEQLTTAKASASKRGKLLEGVRTKLTETEAESRDYQIAFLSAAFRVDKSVVETAIDKFDSPEKVEEALKKANKSKRVSEHKVEVPKYTPDKKRQDKASYLENLTKS